MCAPLGAGFLIAMQTIPHGFAEPVAELSVIYPAQF